MLRRIALVPVLFAMIVATRAGSAFAQSEERPLATSSTPAPVRSTATALPGTASMPATSQSQEPLSPSPSPTPPFNRLGWRSLGPAIAGGRVTSVVGSVHNPFLYYVGAAGGGVWKTLNAGATWQPVFDKQSVSSIGAIAIDPSNDDVVWVGTGETNPRNDVSYGAGVYRTIDGGKTWSAMGLASTLQISSIVISAANPNHVVAGAMGDFFANSADRGVYVTDDAGSTWRNTLYVGPQTGVSDLAVDPQHANILYAGLWQFRRQPWTFTSGGPDDGLYKSIDGGATWSRLSGHGLPTGITGRIGIAVSASDPNRVYALIEAQDGILWRSDDAGATWKLMSKNTLVDQRPFYFTHIAVDPKDAQHVYGVSEMLSESKDGGATFKEIADTVHVDYHSIWIAPNDPHRIIVGEDGGYALTLDGEHWSDNENLPIGQIYHVGYDDQTPYRVCVSLQDNNGFCGPSNALDPNGNPNRAWERIIGGDGMWAWPDPLDPNLVWTDLQDGNVTIFDRTTRRNTFVRPWLATSLESFDISRAKYRFNWDSPIAFAPWDPHVTWYGGNVVFETHDRGRTWHAISPDLTRNDKAHQRPSGGPLALDVSGAEYTDTILDIEGSLTARGEMWVGTDDGLVQMTRDGGAHWRNVTPPGIGPDGRFEMVAPSPVRAGTAYTVYDRHEVGDRGAYAFVTHDFGATWTSIAAGLPPSQPVRSIRPDTHDPNLVFVGTENGIFASHNGGAQWRAFNLNMPPAAVYDIRIQPRFDDLLVATHGRGLYILDDLAPIRGLPAAQAAGAMLFAPKPAYEFAPHADEQSAYTAYYGRNPASGAAISFYQANAGARAPDVRIYDAGHHLVRTITGTRCVERRALPFVSNDAGLNRVIWDFREAGPIRWNGAARESFKGPLTGPAVVPGTYTVEMMVAGKAFREPVTVKPDPRVAFTSADYRTSHAFVAAQTSRFSMVDAALNRLDAVEHDARKRSLSPIADRAHELRSMLTADYHNDEDSIQRPGKLREDLQSLIGFRSGSAPPSAATRAYAARVDAQDDALMGEIDAFFAKDVANANAALKGTPGGALAQTEPAAPLDCAADD